MHIFVLVGALCLLLDAQPITKVISGCFQGGGSRLLGGVSVLMLCWWRFDSPVQQGTFPLEPSFRADALTVFVDPTCAAAHISICKRVKNPKRCSRTSVWRRESRSVLEEGNYFQWPGGRGVSYRKSASSTGQTRAPWSTEMSACASWTQPSTPTSSSGPLRSPR